MSQKIKTIGLFLYCFLFAYSSQALSEGILIGNGGGLAEMQALHIDLSLEKQIILNAEYSDFLEKLKERKPLLEFDSSCDLKKYRITQEKIYISSCALYSDRGGSLGLRPKPLNQIASLVFAVRWLSINPGDSFEMVLAEASAFYETLELKKDSYSFVYSGNLEAFLTVQKVQAEHLFVLEFKNESVDLSEGFKKRLNCESLDKFKISSTLVFGRSEKQMGAESLAFWSCEGKSYTGRFLFNIFFDELGKVDVEKSDIFLHGVE